MPSLRSIVLASVAAAHLTAPPSASGAPVPEGAEFRINQVTAADQRQPALALDVDGGFVAVWTSTNQESPSSSDGVFSRRYRVDGGPAGPELQVNAHTPGQQFQPAVASDPDGNFVVAWTSDQQDGSGYGIFARRMGRDGAALGGEIQVNTYTPGRQQLPTVAADVEGNFVVAWESLGQDGSVEGVRARRFRADGAPLGGELAVNSYTILGQKHPAVAMAPDGRFVVVWDSSGQIGASHEVYGQLYDGAGAPSGGEFRVNSYTQNSQYKPAVAMDAGGGFVVAWESVAQDGSSTGVYARRFDSTGVPVDADGFPVNLAAAGAQIDPAVAIDPSGNFAVAWTSAALDGSGDGIFLRRFVHDGTPLDFVDVQVNTYFTANQSAAALGGEIDGDLVALWQSFGQDGIQNGIYGQRFTRPTIVVTDTSGGTGAPGCKLRDAISAANLGIPVGGCAVGGDGGAIIELATNQVQLSAIDPQSSLAGLPTVQVPITLRGQSAVVRRFGSLNCPQAPEFRIAEVATGGVLTLDGVRFAYGCVSAGAGGGVDLDGTLVLRSGAALYQNWAIQGGAVQSSGALYGADAWFEGNATISPGSGSGGALNTDASAFTLLRRTLLDANFAAAGGGAAFLNGRAHLSAVTVSGNIANGGPGGGLWTNWIGGATTIDFSTIVENGTAGSSAALYNDSGALRLHGTAIGDQQVGGSCLNAGAFPFVASGANADSDGTCASAAGSNVSTFANLGLLALASNGGRTWTHLPGPASPLRDLAPACAARAGAPVGRDGRGYPRPTDDDTVPGARCDVGAVERGPLFIDGFASGGTSLWF